VWWSMECQYHMRGVKQLEFDVEWEACGGLWMAPLWTVSWPWAPKTGRQGESGEIDFVEECPVPAMNTNLGCYNAFQGDGCVDAQHWATGETSGGVKHVVMTFDCDDLIIHVCSRGGGSSDGSCTQVAFYRNYLSIVYPTREGRNNQYHFVSDIFNDRPFGKDAGWSGCRAERNNDTACKYAVTNIRIHTKDGAPIFAPGSKCAALDAAPTLGA